MRKYILIPITSVAILVGTLAYSASPFPPWFTQFIGTVTSLGSASSNQKGIFPLHVARFVYDVAVDTGTAATHGLGTFLPARAVIVRSAFKVITQFTNSGSATVALTCEDAGNIYAASDISAAAANAFVEGATTGAATTWKRDIAARCEIGAVIGGAGGATVTVGKLVGWVEYVLEN